MRLAGNIWKRFKKNRPAFAGLIIIGLVILLSVFAPLLAPDSSPDGRRQLIEAAAAPPGTSIYIITTPQGLQLAAEAVEVYDNGFRYRLYGTQTYQEADVGATYQSFTYWLGADRFGRDMLTRLLLGARVSLIVGAIAVVVALTIGIALGLLGGYFGGGVDLVVTWLINVVWSIPTLLLVLGLSLVLGRGLFQIFLAVGLSLWTDVARLVRGQVLAVKNVEYIQAGQSLGLSHGSIMLRHILPNILPPVLVMAAAMFSTAILLEAGLGFLGLGVQPPTPSWGSMVSEHYSYLISGQPHLALLPGFCIMMLVLSFNLVGNGLADAFGEQG